MEKNSYLKKKLIFALEATVDDRQRDFYIRIYGSIRKMDNIYDIVESLNFKELKASLDLCERTAKKNFPKMFMKIR